jgi:hypothetical protein
MLRFLPQQFEELQSWYYWCEEFMKHAVKLASGGMTFIPSCINQKLLGRRYKRRDTDTQTARWYHKTSFIFWQ